MPRQFKICAKSRVPNRVPGSILLLKPRTFVRVGEHDVAADSTHSEAALKQALELITMPPSAAVIQALPQTAQMDLARQRTWVGAPGIVGYGIAMRVTAGSPTDQVALRVYVDRKRPVGQLQRDHRVPSSITIPMDTGVIPIDVEAIGVPVLQPLNARVRPLLPGYSIGVIDGETGTIGAVVFSEGHASLPMLLSNSHVLARSGCGATGDVIVQPGPGDGGVLDDRVGLLKNWVPFNFDAGFNNLCDAAVAQLDGGSHISSDIPEIGTPHTVKTVLTRGTKVQKTGRTSDHTTGIVQDVNYRTFMDYPNPNGGIGSAGFRDQVLCSPYTEPGDSGSLICDMDGNAVGLHWCGSTKVSIFSPLKFALDALNLVIA